MSLFAAVWNHKKYWLMPLIVFLALIGAILFMIGGDKLLPFMYRRL